MNLLPKSHKEFGEKDYWNQFFKKRGNKAFEWYGEYLELCSHLHKYIKPKDCILVPGCGNSSLSADLYDVGLKQITNIDVSEIVVKQMLRSNAHRTDMKFLCMDATKTNFNNDSFNVVLDKGTLDALMPDDSEETINRIEAYFNETKRLLKLGGRFICITLLQSHVLDKLLAEFCDKSWMVRIVRCNEAEAKNFENGDGTTLPVFLVVATKFKAMPQLVLEVCMAGEKMVRVQTPEEIKACIKSVQDTAFITNGLAKSELDDSEEVELDLHEPGEESARYTLHVLDQRGRGKFTTKYAVFIVPQGREPEWLFGTAAGRRQLAASAGASRLAVAWLRRGHHFASLDAVKDELAPTAAALAPPGYTGQIPFMSLGAEVTSSKQVRAGSSEAAGPYVVEDVGADGHTLRRLVFMRDQFLVQSEAKVLTVKTKNKTKTVIDFGHISTYHSYISAGVAMAADCTTGTGGPDGTRGPVALLGLGGGGLAMFLRKCYPNITLTAVDIDPEMLEIAVTDFQLKVDDKLRVEIKDGLDFLKDEAEKAGGVWGAIVVDVDSKSRGAALACPPPAFLRAPALPRAAAALRHTGHLIVNVVCREAAIREELLSDLRAHFAHVAVAGLREEVNEIVFATNRERPYTKQDFADAVQLLNKNARQRNLVKGSRVDSKEFLEAITILS